MTEPAEPPPLIRTTKLEDEIARQEAEDERDLLLQDAQEKAKLLRPLFSNRLFVLPDGKHLRVSFGERVGDEDIFHTALVIPLEEAQQFADLIFRMSQAGLTQMWDQLRAAIAAEQAIPADPNG